MIYITKHDNVQRINVTVYYFRIEYEPKTVGTYTVNVIFGEQEIPTSPYTVKVEPNIDVSGVAVLGLEKGITYIYIQADYTKAFYSESNVNTIWMLY